MAFNELDGADCASCTAEWAQPLLKGLRDQTNSFDGELKVHLFPEAKNQILVRIENLADLFDGKPESTPYFNLGQYANQLYALANDGASPSNIKITERTLGNNQDFSEWKAQRFHWMSDPVATDPAYEWPEDIDDQSVALQPQRIRLFRVLFNSSSQQPHAMEVSNHYSALAQKAAEQE